jgi:hypothetical protein
LFCVCIYIIKYINLIYQKNILYLPFQ